jgi:glycosyltransferase involved in cell wall biosynthesis
VLGSIRSAEEKVDLEIFVVDGGSSDGSFEIIRRFENHLNGWVSEPTTGRLMRLSRVSGAALARHGLAQLR